MRVVYINRHPGEFWSIEQLFKTIAVALPEFVKYRIITVPRAGARLLGLIKNMLWASRIRDADIAHVTGDIHYAVIGIWRIPSVLTIHDLRFVDAARGLRKKLLFFLWIYLPVRRATRVTVISEFTKTRLLSLVRVPTEKVLVIPDCIAPEFTSCVKKHLSDTPVILHVGTTSNKNLTRLSAACVGIKIELWILGNLSSEQREDLQSKRILFKAFSDLSRDDVISLYRRCDIVSFVSLYEGFGLPILEGQAVGRAVLTSNIAPMSDVSGTGALQVDPESVEDIRNGLHTLINDENFRDALIEKGFENVRKYSSTAVAAKYCELYQELLNE